MSTHRYEPEFLLKPPEQTFVFGEGREAERGEQWVCPCGNRQFEIGYSSYTTVAMCTVCGEQCVIHEG